MQASRLMQDYSRPIFFSKPNPPHTAHRNFTSRADVLGETDQKFNAFVSKLGAKATGYRDFLVDLSWANTNR